jgi:biopolymer transport protein ExbD
MAEVDTGGGGDHGKHGKKRAKRSSTKIDMTPMVDLAFLLLTFFMLTTTFSKPNAMEINMPLKDPTVEPPKIAESTVMTVILSENNKIYYYYGITDPKVEQTNFGPDGIRKVLLKRNKKTIDAVEKIQKEFEPKIAAAKEDKEKTTLEKDMKIAANKVKGDKNALMVLIKTDDLAKYKNVVDILDEMAICTIGKYALVDITPVETEMIKNVK